MAAEAEAGIGPKETWWHRLRASLRELYCLPPRVQALVDAELQRADILGAWISLSVALFLGVVYLLSPKALDSLAPVRPVPYVTALFLAVSLVRLKMAHDGMLSRLAQTAFILVDVALLYGLIWSYHLQYDQPAAFYLKAPTFLFIFLLIAIRALRFEPVAIVVVGVAAAAGWAAMTAYAIQATPEPAITRDFTRYITGNQVLIGAEVEKIIAILLVTLVLTSAIALGRRSLVLAVRGSNARDDLSRFFAPEVAARITEEDSMLRPGFGEIRHGAVLVADIRGFTVLAAKRPAAEVVSLLIEYQRRMAPVIKAHGGVIDKFLGDGILATFGCARTTAAPSADAVRALLALLREADAFAQETAERFGEPIEIGFAVVSGPVLCGTVGDDARLEFTVIGEAVNRAAKLEKTNKAEGTLALVEAETLATAREEGLVGQLDGFAERWIDLADGLGSRRVFGLGKTA
ncbi:MAG TPA: adenylate/guanylate cyclase domain-containing protein [Microvirga sp.]|jgi:adenylate cyclase|nr:adenylate/guanylate cyclase domain-containing protein [Microvirga sp.]